MRLLLVGTFLAMGIACANHIVRPIKTQVVTYPEGGIIEFNGMRVGRAPAAVVLPQDTNGRLTERAVLRAIPNTAQPTLNSQSRIFDPATRTDRVPDQVMIDLTLRGTNEPARSSAGQPAYVEMDSRTNKVARARRYDRGKPTQPVGVERWNPGIY